MRFRGSTLLKYVLSYILILAVSFAGLYFILSVQLKSEYEKKIKNETALKLSNVSKMLSQRFTDIQTTNYLIENDMTFINARYSQSDYTRYLAVNELKKLATFNALIHDILYIDIENGDLLAANSSCDIQDGHISIKTTRGSISIPDDLIYSRDYSNIICALKGPSQTLFAFLCQKNSENYRTIYILDEIQLRAMINMYTVQEITAVGLLCNQEMVFSSDGSAFTNVHEFNGTSGEFVSLNDQTDLYMQSTSLPQLTVVACIDTMFLKDYVTDVFEKSYLSMAVLAVLGITIVLFAMKTTYVPLHRLMKRITNKSGHSSNDIQLLNCAFDEYLDEKKALVAKIDYYKGIIKKTVQLSQTDSNEAADSDFNEKIDTLFSENFKGVIYVAILSFASSEDNPALVDSAGLPNEKELLLITLESSPGQLTLFVGLQEGKNESDQTAARLFCAIREKYGCRIAYSDSSANPLDISRLYYMAKQAQPFTEEKAIVRYSPLCASGERDRSPSYPYQIFDELSLHLQQLDFDKAHEKVDRLFQLMDTESSPVVFIRCILMDVLTLLNTSMNVHTIKFDKYKSLFTQTLHLCRTHLDTDAKRAIRKNMHAILTVFADAMADRGPQTAQIVRFVEENCLHPDFTLQYLADHFHVSTVYMSSLFVKKFHINFSDYVWKMRLDRAKFLLETTDDSIEKICVAVGYDIPSSFRRKFKQEVGLSPSEYKKRAAEGIRNHEPPQHS